MEGRTDIGKILKEIQMVFFDIKDQTDFRIKAQEAVGIFTGLSYEVLRMTDPDIAAYRFQDAANGKGGIQPCTEQDLRDHGCSRGLAMGTADGDGQSVILHHLSKKFRSGHKGKRKLSSSLYLRIIRVYGTGINNKIQIV